MSNQNNDLLYDVNYDLIKSVKVHLEYDFVTSLDPSYETSKESFIPASEDKHLGVITINNPIIASTLVKLANDNNYNPTYYFILDQFLKSKGSSLRSFYDSFYYPPDEEVYDLIDSCTK